MERANIQTIQTNQKILKMIYFDMDGTIADLYTREGWLRELRSESCAPYREAAPLVELGLIAELLVELQAVGYGVGIISWLAKNSSDEYKNAVRQAKKEWLQENFPLQFDEIHIVQYGTRKDYVAKDKNGILFDDDEKVRNKWRGQAINPQEENIIDVLKRLLEDM